MACSLGIGEHVDFCVNAPFEEVQQLLAGAVGGLHTMQDEHFGISIVEYMAAGEEHQRCLSFMLLSLSCWQSSTSQPQCLCLFQRVHKHL